MDLLDEPDKNLSFRNTTTKRVLCILIYATGVCSLFYSISILAFYIHARVILGKFPSYANPDPAELSICGDYYKIIFSAFGIWIISFLLWLIFSFIYVIVTRRKIYWRPLAITLFAHLLSIVITLSPIFEWYID